MPGQDYRNDRDWSVYAAGTVDVSGTPTVDQVSFSTVKSGEIIVGTAGTQFPTVTVRHAAFRAAKGNAGTVYIGGGSTVSVPNGTADATTGYQLAAGDSLELDITNTNKCWGIASADGQSVVYIATL